jgi:dihydrofolate reductase
MMNDTPKIVVSTTLKVPDWGQTTLIRSDVAAELGKLKREPGKDISVGASGTLVRFLLQEGLLDELHLHVHPIVVGTGRHLFEEGTRHVPLQLLESRPFTNGVVSQRYVPAG